MNFKIYIFLYCLIQDPVNPTETVIVIRSLVPGGVAQLDGRLVPGDRLIFVNDVNLENATLDEAVQALKGAATGVVRIGVAKPLPLAESFTEQEDIQVSVRLMDLWYFPCFLFPPLEYRDFVCICLACHCLWCGVVVTTVHPIILQFLTFDFD